MKSQSSYRIPETYLSAILFYLLDFCFRSPSYKESFGTTDTICRLIL